MAEQLFYAAAAGFEAARELPRRPLGRGERRLHGHSFLATVCVGEGGGPATFPGDEVRALRERLAAAVAPLDYSLLNRDELTVPSDENLARWVRGGLGLEGAHNVGIQSTSDGGVHLDESGQARAWRRYRFEAAHRLPNVPPGHKCGVMHGHGFEVILRGAASPVGGGMFVDHEGLDAVWAPLRAELDHACLNDIPGLENPTSEMISRWIWERLAPARPQLSLVTVYETAACGAHFDGGQYRIWKDFSLDSAVQLRRAPRGDARRRVHGHTYLLRLHLVAPLDRVLGWTVDFGDVKARFTPLFKQLDHQPLHGIEGIGDGDVASVARWIRRSSGNILPQLDRIDLYETRGCGAVLSLNGAPALLPV